MSLRIRLFLTKTLRSMPVVHRATWKMRKVYNRVQRFLLVKRRVVDAAPVLKNAIAGRIPYAAGKMGSTEVYALHIFLRRQRAMSRRLKVPAYPAYIYHTLHVNSGVYPQASDVYDRFCPDYLNAVKQCDMLVAWDVAGEAEVLSGHCQQTTLVKFRTLEPFFSAEPWTAALIGKRVLAISPFAASIREQYKRRETLWDNPNMLPAFELLTLQAPLSAGLVTPKDADWFKAVERLQKEMDLLDYDVALIGAGAFSLPLAVHARERGKVGIHLGGSLQILFGVLGERWRKDKDYRGFIKDSWQRPNKEETPKEHKKNEEGCYW